MFFSIVTPTYNRAKLIHRVYESLVDQTFKDFEWVIIDDGSIDNTEEIIYEYIENSNFPIKYIKIENNGKAAALNESVKYCSGIMYLVFDSDDWCKPNALEVFYGEWHKVSSDNKYVGISCLKMNKYEEIIGDTYDNIKYNKNYIDRLNMRIKGDKWECILLNEVKKIKYPLTAGEKYMAPGYVWIHLEADSKILFLNKALSIIEYQDEGISKNNLAHRMGSLNNTIRYNYDAHRVPRLRYVIALRYYSNYIRFSFHARHNLNLSWRFLPGVFFGGVMFFYDNIILRKKINL